MNAPKPPWSDCTLAWDGLAPGNSFASLGRDFSVPTEAQPLPAPYRVATSPAAAALLGLAPEQLARPEALAVLAGNQRLQGSVPVATVYSGHQFGVWAGQLGDGRALLLGDFPCVDGRRLELQLKGAGLTRFSRMGDGRAVLRSSIREFLCSEAMAALGIPTTRALSVVGADFPVYRETVETAAVVSRLAPSFLRFGHFEHFYRTGQHQQLRALADYLLTHFMPDLPEAPNPYQEMLAEIVRRTARLIADWQAVGFCHGVMNT
ncbi:MAG: protein adenylyltransferase SelO family protein, partial [Quisquiliibacterium sp.]